MLELPFVGERQDRKVPHLPGVYEYRLKRGQAVVVSILGEQHPTLLLTAIPQAPVVEVAWELKVAEGHETEVEFGEDGPQVEGFERVPEAQQVALDIHVR